MGLPIRISGLLWASGPAGPVGGAMSQFPDELGAWWTDFPGSDKAAWLTPSAPSLSPLAPAQEGVRGAVSRRALRHRLVVPAGKRERARREAAAEWRRQAVTAIREPS